MAISSAGSLVSPTILKAVRTVPSADIDSNNGRGVGNPMAGFSPVKLAALAFLLMPIMAHANVAWQDYPDAGLASSDYTFPYTSPYTVNFTIPTDQLLYDFSSRYNSVVNNTSPSQALWYNAGWYGNAVDQAWGPQIVGSLGAPEAPSNPDSSYGTLAWQQQRLVAIATQFQLVNGNALGTIYQHHHLPQFSPYTSNPNWPADLTGPPPITWGTANGGNSTASAGIDCSDFTSLVYNLAFGYQLDTNVNTQAQPTTPITTPTGSTLPTAVIAGPTMNNGATLDPNDQQQYDDIVGQFEVGDLLYMHSGTGTPGNGTFSDVHVVMWLGLQNITFTTSANITANATIPLIISSHNDTPAIWDENGVLPAPGVQILPFAADSWFYTNFDHAQRILIPEPGPATLAAFGVALLLVLRWSGLRKRSEIMLSFATCKSDRNRRRPSEFPISKH